jgi:hypothetical protein
LGISGRRWLELRWLKRISERVSPKARVLPRRSRMVYGASSLLFLPLLLEDGLESFLVWTIIRAMVIVFLMENAIPFSCSLGGLGPCHDLCLYRRLSRLCGLTLDLSVVD